MPKKTKKSNNNNNAGGVSGRGSRKQLDAAAYAYARLLADPCGAPLVQPIFPGADAGFMIRAESFLTFGTAAGDTAGVVHWAPGFVNASNTELCVKTNATSGGTLTSFANSGGGPGKYFLGTNARGARCVAACMRVTFPGSESARSGRIHYGHTTAGMIDVGDSMAVDDVCQTLQHYSRTPPDTVELVWKPSFADCEFNDPGAAANAQVRDRKSSLTFAWAGLPAAVGLTFHFTAVYEWTPAAGFGVGYNSLGKAVSSNTLDDVLDALISSGFTFVKQVGHAAMTGLTSYMSAKYGLMAAGRVTRSLNFR